jgi:hypothetical protein
MSVARRSLGCWQHEWRNLPLPCLLLSAWKCAVRATVAHTVMDPVKETLSVAIKGNNLSDIYRTVQARLVVSLSCRE